MSVNKVILLGRLGQDPEIRYTPTSAAVCNFSIATSEAWTDKAGEKKEKTEWHRIVVWGKLAELCNQYLSKGRQVFVEGRLQTRSWDDKDGTKRYMTEIVANTVQFIGGQAQAGKTTNATTATTATTNDASAPSAPPADVPAGVMDREYNVSNDINFTADDIPF